MYPLFILYFVVGTVIGSFLNVCIYRLPVGMSIISPPSRCGSCGHRLGALDMIPVFSYLFLCGRCRYCGVPYSCRYMIIELLTGFLFASCGYYYLPGLTIVLAWFFIACLIVQTCVDFDHQVILDKVLLAMVPTGILHSWFGLHDPLDAALGVAFAGGLMLVIYLVSRGGMGLGDVKLAAVLGLWLGLKPSIVCVFTAFLIGGIVGVVLLATGIKGRKDAIPFGPYLCFGAYISLLFSPYLIYWYWTLFI